MSESYQPPFTITPANHVKKLMAELLSWLSDTEQHPLIASSVFHY